MKIYIKFGEIEYMMPEESRFYQWMHNPKNKLDPNDWFYIKIPIEILPTMLYGYVTNRQIVFGKDSISLGGSLHETL